MTRVQKATLSLLGLLCVMCFGLIVAVIVFAVKNEIEWRDSCQAKGGVYYDGGRGGRPACLKSDLFIEVK